LFEKLPDWLTDDTIKPSTAKGLKGLEDVPKGFDEHRAGKIPGYKTVHDLDTAA
jgi:hypothetical protein